MLAKAAFLGTDYSEHARIVLSLSSDRSLSYTEESYPRGVHAGIAWLLSMTGDLSLAGDRWTVALIAVVVASWGMAVFTLAAMGMTVAHVIERLSRRVQLVTLFIGMSGLALFATTAAWTFGMMMGGFLTTAAAALIVAALIQVTAHLAPGSPVAVVIGVAAVLAMAQVWPLLLPAVGAGFLIAGVTWWQGKKPQLAWIFLTAAGGSLLAIPPLWAIATQVGISATAIPGGFISYPIPLTALILAAFCCVAVLGWRHGARNWWFIWAAVIGVLVTEVVAILIYLVATGRTPEGPSGFGSIPYYPAKILWHAVTAAMPAAVAAGAVLFAALLSLPLPSWCSRHRLIRPLALLSVGVLGVAVLGSVGWLHLQGAWGRQTLTSVAPPYPLLAIDAVQGQPKGSVIVRGLNPRGLSVYAGETDRAAVRILAKDGWETPSEGASGVLFTEELCDWLKTHPAAVRLTGPNPDYGPTELLRNGCSAEVVRPEDWIRLTAPDDWQAPAWTDFSDGIPTPIPHS